MGVRGRRWRKGKWTESFITADLVAKLMGTSPSKAKRILYKLRESFGKVDEDLIGEAIQEVRNQRDLKYYEQKGKKAKRRVHPKEGEQ